ncbi:MAG: chalcone isomerase family protein [Candidatus Thiodiazotropha sp.]
MKSLTAILCLLLCLVTGNIHARLSPLHDYPSLQSVGSGELTWLGFKVYQATLYAPLGQYGSNRPHALEIVYNMSISREQLAKTSLKEIEKLRGAPLVDREGVLDQFEQVFRDVSDGDSIVGLHLPGEGARFYSGSDYLGRIDDPELAAAFFDIWLSPATSKPELRSGLLGAAE